MKKYVLYAALACPLSSQQLTHIQVPYWGFDDKSHTGTLVVNKNIADETIQIFQAIYNIRFPIEKIKPLGDYGNNEEKAMKDNDTFSYNCKKMTSNSKRFSTHAYGLAIDINPLLNPYISRTKLLPINSEKYTNRDQVIPGMISANSEITKIFLQQGWTWGGNWRTIKDYHHFEVSPRGT